ncbi:MAG: hypothetical protein KDJ30_02675, partial [Rhodoblastus sp.]|nr:hypothetical protein [Rhodoblastus sp.]
ADAATLAAAGLVDLVALIIAVTLPHALAPQRAEPRPAPPLGGFAAATIVGALAWFVMTLLMARASPTLVACGVASAAVGGVIAWHLVAMYAPAAIIRFAGTEPPPAVALVVGLVTLAAAAALFWAGPGATLIGVALAGAGVGWSLANAGLMQWIYGAGAPTRLMLALHDFALLTAALGGALIAPLV